MKNAPGSVRRHRKSRVSNRDRWAVSALALIASAIATWIIITLRSTTKHPAWAVTVAIINKIARGRSGGRLYQYILNGVIYQGWTAIGHRVNEPGDVHLIRFNPDDTSESEWIDDRTYFLPSDSLAVALARVTDKWVSNDSLSYLTLAYAEGGRGHSRIECISARDALKVEVGARYYVQFAVEHPERVKLLIPVRRWQDTRR